MSEYQDLTREDILNKRKKDREERQKVAVSAMDHIVLGKADELQEKANELQGKANEHQQQMIMEIETNSTETSKHNNAIKWLTIAIVVLTFFTVLSSRNKTGRYTCVQGSSGLIIFDTKTNELWLRDKEKTAYYGTIEKPVFEIREIDK